MHESNVQRILLRAALLAAVLAAVPPSDAVAQDAVASRAAAPKAPRLLEPETLQKKTVYTHAPFDMDVSPPIGRDGEVIVESLKFPSPVASEDPDRNDVVRARLFRTREPEKAAVIALGGWRFDPLTPELARRIAESGIQVVWVEIPFQGQRTPKGSVSGRMTLSDDLERNERVFIQLAQDVGRLRHWLVHERGIDPDRIGLLGTSLGGFAAATLYGMEPSYRALTVQIAGSDIVEVLYNDNWLTDDIRAGLVKRGIDDRTARGLLRGMNPGTWADPARGDGVLIVAAEKDEIVPLHTAEDLRERYGSARLLLMEGAIHVSGNELRAMLPKVRAHFERVLLGRESGTRRPAREDDDTEGAGSNDGKSD